MAEGLDLLNRYFRDLTQRQKEQFEAMEPLYTFWNERINLISRKDMEHFYLHHVLHSMVLSWYCNFEENSLVLDIGTGGGFPGIPLAIMFPDAEFLLIDGTLKKLKVVEDVSKQLGLENVQVMHARIEEHRIRHDYTVSRAVSTLPTFVSWLQPSLDVSRETHKGIFYLKGGDCEQEARETGLKFKIYPLGSRIREEYYASKKVAVLTFHK
jgi:16S rRNA (guanine527-N7)-methyltransferase